MQQLIIVPSSLRADFNPFIPRRVSGANEFLILHTLNVVDLNAPPHRIIFVAIERRRKAKVSEIHWRRVAIAQTTARPLLSAIFPIKISGEQGLSRARDIIQY